MTFVAKTTKSTTVGSGSEEATTAAGTAAVETAPAIPVAVQVRAEERGRRRRRPGGGRGGGGAERGGGEAAEVGLAVQPRAKQVTLKVPFIFIF